MNKYSVILLFVFCASFFTGCKKYYDGPLISFRSKEKRLINTWHLESYLINNVDKTVCYANIAYTDYTIVFNENKTVTEEYYDVSDSLRHHVYTWHFDDNKERIILEPGIRSLLIWRLTSKELWAIKEEVTSDVHQIRLVSE